MWTACILISHLPVQAERRRNPDLNNHPLVIGGRPWDPGAVLDCCPLAEAVGVRIGMRLSRAEALCPSARFLPAEESAYRAAHEALNTAMRQFTDRIETAGLGLLLADVTDLERTFGHAAQLSRHLTTAVSEATRLVVQVGLASNRFTAEQAARAAKDNSWCPVIPGQERTFLSPLSVSALPAEPEVMRRLTLLGIVTLGAFAALPRLAVIRQFGPQAGFLHDLASGSDPRPVHADAPPLVLENTRTFERPMTNRGQLAAWIGRMSSSLSTDLARRSHQAEGLRIQLVDEAGQTHSAATRVEPPTNDHERITRLAVTLLERLKLTRPIIELCITLYPLRPAYLGAAQLALFSEPADSRRSHFQEALRRLRERFGEMVLVVAALVAPPLPRPVQVTAGDDGIPRALVLPDRILPMTHLYEHWRERRRWWGRPLERDYFRVETDEDQVRVAFRDVRSNEWWLERRHL